MSSKRKSLSKSLRFEIFKRDGFACIYCGVTPSNALLRVDHVVPVAAGGKDDAANLVTSCFDCNAGKSDKRLEDKKLPAKWTHEEQREHAEQIREWLAIQRDVDSAKDEVVDSLVEVWRKEMRQTPDNIRRLLTIALRRDSPVAIREAILATGHRRLYGDKELRYFYGVLRNMRGDKPTPKPKEVDTRTPDEVRRDRVRRHLSAFSREVAGVSIERVIEEFYLAAYALPDEDLRAVSPEILYEMQRRELQHGANGLAIVTRPAGDEFTWSIELHAAREGASAIEQAVADVQFKTQMMGLGYSQVSEVEGRTLNVAIEHLVCLTAFLLGADGAEQRLREMREHFGIENPKWRAE